ncbi:MAG: 50S ribosomal protein L3 [Oscillospiraceae bacterium]|nr:50S ribosomal protein L3 [Oscillospiraceae bacterium]
MKKFMLGTKVGMTQIFDETGIAIPVTVVEAGPCTVVQKKSIETDGYVSLKIGYIEVPEKRLTKPEYGVFKSIGAAPHKHLKEFKPEATDAFEVGQVINASDMFETGDRVDVSGISKGKGFQGVIKRYGHSLGRETHGSKFHRGIGSLSANSFPGRIFKGKKMPGHMGNVRVTAQNLDVVRVDKERNLMLIKGSVPGARGALLEIRETVKQA